MPEQADIKRAQLIEVELDEDSGSRRTDKKGSAGNGSSQGSNGSTGEGKTVPVQFNPQTLKVSYKNQKANSDQPDGQGSQFVGRGTAKLNVDLLFDATRSEREGVKDVRDLTRKVRYFMEPKKQKKKKSKGGRSESDGSSKKEVFVQPGVRFQWGNFALEGVMDSMNETLEFFDEKGHPLRASVSIGITQHSIRLKDRGKKNSSTGGSSERPESSGAEEGAGGRSEAEQSSSPEGNESRTSVQQLAGEAGRQSEWKEIAQANGVENPRAIRNPSALDLSL